MGDTEVLVLRLEASLQAWGDASHWGIRDTRPEPTKSGVLGLLAACFGWCLDGQTDALVADLARRTRMGVRVEREGTILRDYHTVGGARSGGETAWTGLLTAEGKIKRNPTSPGLHTELSERNYLADACYLVGLEAEAGIVDDVEQALRHPAWPPFLGRKSCPPCTPIYPPLPALPGRQATALLDVVSTYPWLGARANEERPACLRVVLDEGPDTPDGMRGLRHDVPISFASRRFGHRYVREFTVPCPGKE